MIKIAQERLDESIGIFQKILNGDVIDVMKNLSGILTPERGSNEQIDQVYADCQKFQTQFNELTEVMRKTVTETGKLIDIGEYLKKFDISTVSSRDTSAETGSIDTDAVIM